MDPGSVMACLDKGVAPETGVYDGVILAVAHNVFEEQGIDAIKRYAFDKHVFYDLKSLFGAHAENLRL